MQRPNFKRIDDSLAFNTPGSEPIFQIVHENEHGYTYFLKTTPYGDLKFVWKDLVLEPEEEPVEEAKDVKAKNK